MFLYNHYYCYYCYCGCLYSIYGGVVRVWLMDHSVNCSSRGIVGGSKKPIGSDGESGWTSYLEDFSKGIEPSYCSSLDGSSLLSDAASSAAWKFSHHHHHLLSSPSFKGSNTTAPNPPKKLTFKKARAKQISQDDPLEDTASSPVNSPKVCFLSSQFYHFITWLVW